MVSFTTLLATAAALAAVSADSTTAACNPLKSDNCPPVKALGTDITENFASKPSDFEITALDSGFSFGSDGMELTIKKQLDNPSIRSDFYIMFGRVEAHIQAAKGTGIVSSFFLQSDDLDEIDVEWLGGDTTQVQSNYFTKGNTATYDRGEYHSTPGSPQNSVMNYTLVWTKDTLTWYIEGAPVRTLTPATSQGYPQTPMRVFAGIWAGGDPSNAPGTIEWAGGPTDYSQAPFSMIVQKLEVSDYSSGDSYSYNGNSGSWQSIVAKNGQVNGRIASAGTVQDDSANVASSSVSSTSSSTASSSTSTSTSASTSSSSSSSSTSSSSSSSTTTTSTSSSSSTSPSTTTKALQASSTDQSHTTVSVKTSLAAESTVAPSTLATSSASNPASSSASKAHSVSSAGSGSSLSSVSSAVIFVGTFMAALF